MSTSENLVLLGIVTIFVGFLLILIGVLLQAKRAEFAFVGFIGPFPIGFGTSKKILFLSLAISLMVLFLFILLARI